MKVYICIFLFSVFISSFSQVMLKKAALKEYENPIKEYINPLVISAYLLFFGTTVLGIIAYRVIPVNIGPVLEATGYLYITFLGFIFFKEKITKKKAISLGMIISGIILYTILP